MKLPRTALTYIVLIAIHSICMNAIHTFWNFAVRIELCPLHVLVMGASVIIAFCRFILVDFRTLFLAV